MQHIRSHVFKTTTINITDLKVEPLPIEDFPLLPSLSSNTSESSQDKNVPKCLECNAEINGHELLYKERAKHYMQITNEIHSCPVCLYVLPTHCALAAHLRIHLKQHPYICPECGIYLNNKLLQYPYNHDCDGFRMIRTKNRLKCSVESCQPFHPTEYNTHMKEKHLKIVYRCPICVVACFTKIALNKHVKNGHDVTKYTPIIFYQCQLCPGRLVLEYQLSNHIKLHNCQIKSTYPCWSCNTNFSEIFDLLNHAKNECTGQNNVTSSYEKGGEIGISPKLNLSVLYRVVKQCDKCKRSVTYKCKYSEINTLPYNCPFDCSAKENTAVTTVLKKIEDSNISKIKCPLCDIYISEEWFEIKKHFDVSHKNDRCLDVSVVMERKNLSNYKITKPKNKKLIKRLKSRKINKRTICKSSKIKKRNISKQIKLAGDLICIHCEKKFDDKTSLEQHMISHKSSRAAYQCLECGKRFLIKRSFATHLLVHHDITDVENYIKINKCFNEEALEMCQSNSNENNEPLQEHQCKICRRQYDDDEQLENHSKIHGMAFLVAKKLKKLKQST